MTVAVIHNRDICYPDGQEFYSPSERYPEYPFAHTASRPNLVYRAVRECLAQAGLDASNYGSSLWNPLRTAIKEGSNVFVLCNFVYHKRPSENLADFSSKCTHGSVLRAILDYVFLAAGETGTVRFGNAPIQSCDWGRVLDETGAARVIDFYRTTDRYSVEACDLRSYIVRRDALGGMTPAEDRGTQADVPIDLGKDSLLEDLGSTKRALRFRSLDYDPQATGLYHGPGKHVYVLHKTLLEADVVMNVPKLKTHEKVGVTLGVKNCVGGITHKHCLAHFRQGPPRQGGDEYQDGQLINAVESKLDHFVSTRALYNSGFRALLFVLRKFILHVLGRNVGGGWEGNDTTWRMGMDIARILRHADKTGALFDSEQRKILEVIDGVVAGEGQGPLKPEAKPVGYVSYSDDLVAGDAVATCFMGLDPERFPVVYRGFSLASYGLTKVPLRNVTAIVNGVSYDLGGLKGRGLTPFKMPAGWMGSRDR